METNNTISNEIKEESREEESEKEENKNGEEESEEDEENIFQTIITHYNVDSLLYHSIVRQISILFLHSQKENPINIFRIGYISNRKFIKITEVINYNSNNNSLIFMWNSIIKIITIPCTIQKFEKKTENC